MGPWPDAVAGVVAVHLRRHFEEYFVNMPMPDDTDVVLGVVNHVCAWDAELLMLATLRARRAFMLLGDQHVVSAHPGISRLGIVSLDSSKSPTEAVRALVDDARRRSPAMLWVMPQRSHWPIARTSRIEHAAASFGRHLGYEAIRFANLRYEFNAARRPFVSLCVERSQVVSSGSRISREAWMDGLRNAEEGHVQGLMDGGYTGLLRPGAYGHTSGVPTSIVAVQRAMRETDARVSRGSPIQIARNGVSLEDLEKVLGPLGMDRAASLTWGSQP